MIEQRVFEAIEAFREERIEKIKKDMTPFRLSSGGKIIIHLIPAKSVAPLREPEINISKCADNPNMFRAAEPNYGFGSAYCFDGLVSYVAAGDDHCLAYALLFRTGIIEWVDSYYLPAKPGSFPIYDLEQGIVKRTKEYLGLQKDMGIEPPITYYLHFLGTRGLTIEFTERYVVREDELLFPGMIIENYDLEVEAALKTRFDQLWNAFGYPRSRHYDESGKWNKDPK